MDGRAGATLSLNVLSFQTSFETWTTAAIINWKKLLRLSVVSKLEEISSLRPALPSGPYQPHISFILKSNPIKSLPFKMKEDVNGLVGLRLALKEIHFLLALVVIHIKIASRK